MFLGISFGSIKGMSFILISWWTFVKTGRVYYTLTLKGCNLTGKDHVAYQSIRIVDLKHLRCFHRSSLSPSKGIAEKLLVTFHNLKNLGVMRRGHWSQFSYSWCQVHLSPNVWARLNWFSSKRAPSNFLPLTYNGEFAKLTWALVTYIKIPR